MKSLSLLEGGGLFLPRAFLELVGVFRALCRARLSSLHRRLNAYPSRIPGVQHAVDFAAVLGPLLNLVVVAVIRQEGIVGLFVGPIGHCGVGSFDLVRTGKGILATAKELGVGTGTVHRIARAMRPFESAAA
jgi:hypothetical protein